MHPPAYSLAQSHLEDMRRAAAAGGRRDEARRAAAEGLSTRPERREFAPRPTMFRRLVTRSAI